MQGKEVSSLYRTFAPKYSQYSPDGLGRDTYINYNNGGFLSCGAQKGRTSDHFYVKNGNKQFSG